ncbi:MAG: NAD(P)-dependent oxidoreductase [Candidatus Lokiarchaeota archaeon]|nr:NAD(P)-dependent oxidoreductase [Candidatus Lokiarchaeota archaeon]
MKIFLTGGTGFIGSYVVKELSDSNHEITILARNTNKVPNLRSLKGVSIVKGELSSKNVIKENLKDKDICIHIALGWGDDAIAMLINDTFPSISIFETSAELEIKHLIYTSSTAAIGRYDIDINSTTKTTPKDYYGATKASSETFLHALSYQYPMRCNIIRPGYTFGNPVIEGADIESDDRFKNIIEKAKNNEDIILAKYDGTQFIWAGDLAKVYLKLVETNFNRGYYFGLGSNFITWKQIAKEAIDQINSSSNIKLVDEGYSPVPPIFDVSPIKTDLGLEFDSWDRIKEHIKFLIEKV